MNQKDLFIFLISFKNLWRHKRRTIINIIGIAISVMMITFFFGYYRGTYQTNLFEAVINLSVGHIQIHSKSFQSPTLGSDSIDFSLKNEDIIKDYQPILSEVSNASGNKLSAISVKLKNFGFISNGKEKFPVMVVGVLPQLEKNFSPVPNSIVQGKFIDVPGEGIVIGENLAKLFDFKVGDLAYVYSTTVDGQPNLVILSIIGISKTKYTEFDKLIVFLHFDDAKSLFNTEGVNEIIVKLKKTSFSKDVSKTLKEKLKNLKVEDWEETEVIKVFKEGTEGNAVMYAIIFGIILLIALSTIMSTMYVSVYERTREIGTLRAIGWSKGEVFKLFLFESINIGVIGSLIGVFLGGFLSLILYFFPISFEAYGEVMAELSVMKIASDPRIYDFIISFIIGVFGTYVSGVFPSLRASKMIITEALKVRE
jgi:putative ABC transport system permease protein